MTKDEIIERLNEIVLNLTLIQWCDLEEKMTSEMSKMICSEINELQKMIKELKNL